MKALVVGSGGREHALVRALRLSPSVKEVHALPGNDGIAREARCHPIDWQNFDLVEGLVRKEGIDLVVIGPEVPVVGGLSDALRAKGIAVFAPSREAGELEGSKIACKEFLVEAGIPTARFDIVSSVEQTMSAASRFAPPYVLKADGLAAGKGVLICQTIDELRQGAHEFFNERVLGDAGARALLEEFSPGYELSYLVLTNGEDFEPLPLGQDHKRIFDGDKGPNTGGMGVVAPIEIDPALRARIDKEVVRPTMALFKKRGFVYRGVLFIGIMMTSRGPSVLEFNVRFGDPETQALLPLLDGEWGKVFAEVAQGRLPKLQWKKAAACCVVLAAEGYPGTPVKGAKIEGLGDAPDTATRYFLHAGTKLDSKQGWVTSGGRVLNAIGIGPGLREAIHEAYAQARAVGWVGVQVRSDIGAKVL